MSRFTSRINEMIGKKPKDTNQSDIDRIEKEVDDGLTNDPVKKQIAQKAKKKRQDLLKSLDEAEGDDFVPRQGPETGGEFEPKSKDDLAQEPSEEPTPDPMTTEGETFYVNLARKALFVDLDNTSLTDVEREIVTQDVEPANAKEVAKVIYLDEVKLSLKLKKGQKIKKVKIKVIIIIQISLLQIK